MLPNKLPKEKLKVIIPLTRHSIESPEISPLESPVKSEATASSDSTVKDRDDDIGSGGTERDGTKRDSAEGDSTEGDRNEMDNTTSFAHLSVSYVDNADTESFARLSVSYANMDRIETIQQSIVIEHWNCHACCKINGMDAENPQIWVDVGGEYCTNLDCRHKRCCNCYYLDCEWQPLQYCDGRPVDSERYEMWYNNFERV